MTRLFFIFALAVSAITATTRSMEEPPLPIATAVYIRADDWNPNSPLIYIGTFDLNLSITGYNLNVNINDARTSPPTPVTRLARTASGLLIKVFSPSLSINAPISVVIN